MATTQVGYGNRWEEYDDDTGAVVGSSDGGVVPGFRHRAEHGDRSSVSGGTMEPYVGSPEQEAGLAKAKADRDALHERRFGGLEPGQGRTLYPDGRRGPAHALYPEDGTPPSAIGMGDRLERDPARDAVPDQPHDMMPPGGAQHASPPAGARGGAWPGVGVTVGYASPGAPLRPFQSVARSGEPQGDGGKPPAAAPAGDDAMVRARKAEAILSALAGSNRAGAAGGAALVRTLTGGRLEAKPDDARFQQDEAAAKAPVQDLLEQHKQAALAKRTADTAALSDPASPASERARAAFVAAYPDMAKSLGPRLATLTAADVSGGVGKMFEAGAANAEKAKAAADSVAARRDAAAMHEREFAERGKDRANSLAVARTMSQARLGDMEDRRDVRHAMEERRAGAVRPGDGLEMDDGQVLTPKQAGALKDMAATHETLTQTLREYRDLIAKNGGMIMPTAEQGQAVELQKRLVPLIGKLEDAGALTVGHQRLVTDQLPGPGEWRTVVNPDRTLAVLDHLQRNMDMGLEAKRRAYGVHSAANSNGSAGSQRIRVRNAQGRVMEISAADEQEAAGDGFHRVGQ